jgi:predicted nucleotidyltransferase
MIDIAQVTSDIAEALKPIESEKVILFGSYAYGVPDEDSDLDICVVESPFTSKWEEKKEIRTLLEHIHLPKDIIVAARGKYEFCKKQINTVFHDIDEKGGVLWQK